VASVNTLCTSSFICTWWNQWARIKDDEYVLSSRPVGSTRVRVALYLLLQACLIY